MPNIYCLLLWWPLNERALVFELWEFHIEQQTNNELMNILVGDSLSLNTLNIYSQRGFDLVRKH